MKNSFCVVAASLSYLIVQPLFASQSVFAQQTLSTTTTTTTNNNNNNNNNNAASSGLAPIYTQQNFEADARSQNLYSFNNPTSIIEQPWNTYQLQVQQIAAQDQATQPSANAQASSSQSSNTSNTNAIMMTGYNGVQSLSSVSGSIFNSTANQNRGSSLSNSGSNIALPSTSVSGTLETPTTVPGLGAE